MNIETNEALIRRNSRIAQFSMLGGLLVLVVGMVVSFQDQTLIGVSFGSLLLGFVFSQVGIYYMNRWGRRPRPDELINKELKGLDGRYSIYHYKTPTSHLLVGPAGVWVLMPRYQRGVITYSNGRWKQKGGNLYLKIFAQEGLGRPDLEVSAEIESVRNYLQKLLPEGELPPIKAALLFTNEKVEIQIDPQEEPPAATLRLNDLKDMLRKAAKNKPISMTRVQEIQDAIAVGG
jgi:hypothetical protein